MAGMVENLDRVAAVIVLPVVERRIVLPPLDLLILDPERGLLELVDVGEKAVGAGVGVVGHLPIGIDLHAGRTIGMFGRQHVGDARFGSERAFRLGRDDGVAAVVVGRSRIVSEMVMLHSCSGRDRERRSRSVVSGEVGSPVEPEDTAAGPIIL